MKHLLDRFNRVPLISVAPTPLEPMLRLSSLLGGAQILIKRDDLTGLAFGGNKIRKLEFELGHQDLEAYDTLVTSGASQSNHARATAAAAARLGKRCELVLERRVRDSSRAYRLSGNILIDHLYGATVHHVDDGDVEDSIDALVTSLTNKGRRPLVIPPGASTAHGALGYVRCAFEMAEQARAMAVSIDHVVLSIGSGGSQAGLIAGFELLGLPVTVWGICHGPPGDKRQLVFDILQELATTLELPTKTRACEIITEAGQIGAGYGHLTPAAQEAMTLTASMDGVLLDPVYTAKSMAGLIQLVRNGPIAPHETVVFLHTGGTPAIFAYADTLSPLHR